MTIQIIVESKSKVFTEAIQKRFKDLTKYEIFEWLEALYKLDRLEIKSIKLCDPRVPHS